MTDEQSRILKALNDLFPPGAHPVTAVSWSRDGKPAAVAQGQFALQMVERSNKGPGDPADLVNSSFDVQIHGDPTAGPEQVGSSLATCWVVLTQLLEKHEGAPAVVRHLCSQINRECFEKELFRIPGQSYQA